MRMKSGRLSSKYVCLTPNPENEALLFERWNRLHATDVDLIRHCKGAIEAINHAVG